MYLVIGIIDTNQSKIISLTYSTEFITDLLFRLVIAITVPIKQKDKYRSYKTYGSYGRNNNFN